jgi:ribosomal biogenesis protein LAS1
MKGAARAWSEADLDVMETRVKAALSLSMSTSDIQSPSQDTLAEEQVSASEKRNLPNGWRLLSEIGGWRPCPIGVFLGGE